MTQEQYEILLKHEAQLKLAYKSRQLSALTSGAVLELATVFEQLGYQLDNRQCGHCVVQMCAKLGDLMIRYEKTLPKEPEYQFPIPNPRFPEPEQEPQSNDEQPVDEPANDAPIIDEPIEQEDAQDVPEQVEQPTDEPKLEVVTIPESEVNEHKAKKSNKKNEKE